MSACGYSESALSLPAADTASFEATVYPVLLANCAFRACHGTSDRFFTVYGPGRARLHPATLPYAPATDAELALSYTRARSMLTSPMGVRRSPLLRKPLAVAAGGAGHEGDDDWGQAIFLTKQDPRFIALFAWAVSAQPEVSP
jgi:hypothetical protein